MFLVHFFESQSILNAQYECRIPLPIVMMVQATDPQLYIEQIYLNV